MTGLRCCIVCGAADPEPLYDSAPPVAILSRTAAGPGHPLEAVGCRACGHVWNRRFDAALYDALYGDVPLTNVPVHPSMEDRLSSLIGWLGGRLPAATIVEVGGGSGHLARLLARHAERVVVYEPCLALTPGMLPEPNVTLVNAPFTGDGVPAAELVVCRQVLEHLVDPAAMLRDIRRCLAEGGHAYVEVPSGAFILRHGAFMDVMLQHVHYFTQGNLVRLARGAGLEPVRVLEVKEGHDFGILFRAGAPAAAAAPEPAPDFAAARDLLARRLEAARRRLARQAGPIALYGATGQAQMLRHEMGGACDMAAVFDDNPNNVGLVLRDLRRPLTVEAPAAERLRRFPAVVIGAYLHDEAIAARLRRWGYDGTVISARPMPLPAGSGMESLFA